MITFGGATFSLITFEFRLGERSRVEEPRPTAPASPPAPSQANPSLPAVGKVTENCFDREYYRRAYPDVAAARYDPLAHYEAMGRAELRNPNAYFDAAGYLARYADVATARVDPYEHYMCRGWLEGRNPGPLFNTRAYLAHYPDVKAAGMNPLAHFLIMGIHEGRLPFGNGTWD